ncbi:MAG: aspartate kinase [Rhodobacterales bacterium]|nr:aspartate kinase [Rhodobacterales bacterium]
MTTTLGRGGSDYSAALFGACLDAAEVWIWTDVDGILTADPRLVAEARSLRQVSYREAAEMSYFGAKVLHPRTLLPCSKAGIPIRIRSTFSPESEGTLVAETSESVPEGVKTVTSIRDMALVTLEGRGMAGIPGVARRIFETTEAAGTNVVMISQASSEQTVSLVARATDAAALVDELQVRFRLEFEERALETIQVTEDVAIVSIIGEGMAGHVGVSGKLCGALGRAVVNVLAIAQGGSERSISVAVTGASVQRAVREVHSAFGLTRVAHLLLVGCGRVGQELLTMVAETRARLADQELELRLIGLCNRRTWALDLNGIDPLVAQEVLASGDARPADAALIARIAQERLTDVVLVDVTAGPTAPLHQLALDAGFHVVTANKIPLAGPFDEYQRLVQARDLSRVRYGYETTFGAGLPVLHTLKELVHTGDKLHAITGCFSGTLGFLCSKLQDGVSLADAVGEAAALGYTEPDPREDLSGRDVARKALIVARAMGRTIEPDDVVLTAMVPDLDDGLDAALAKHGPALGERVKAAAARNEVLRFVAEITEEAVVVGLQEVPVNSAIGALNGPDNILVFRTRRYNTYPLVIQGPGAGAEVTAAGVLGDILKTARGL